jgi:flagellar biosynthesis protein FlhF
MQVKRFEGTEMQEVLRQVKQELGAQAIILSTRHIKKGKGAFGMFGRPMIEVIAAVDRDAVHPTSPVRPVEDTERAPVAALSRTEQLGREKTDMLQVLDPLQRDMDVVKELLQQLVTREQSTAVSAGIGLEREVVVVKKMVEHLVRNQQDVRSPLFVPAVMPFYQRLLASGMDEELARRLMERTQNRLPRDKFAHEAYVQECLANTLINAITVSGPLALTAGQQHIAAFVGPTGVGKTTTIAKLAAHYALGEKKRVALVTVDTYRIAAVEQLRTFAKIIGLPIEVVMSEAELDQTLARHREKDVVLIDTAGRSQRDTLQMAELASCFAPRKRASIHLVLSATANLQNLCETVTCFAPLGLASIVFTKLDESNTFGTILSTAFQAQRPLSYFTTGQRVPEDIELATPERIVDLILNVSHWREAEIA